MKRFAQGYIAPTLAALLLFFGVIGEAGAQRPGEHPPRQPIPAEVLQQVPQPYRDQAAQLQLTATPEELAAAQRAAKIEPDAPLALVLRGMSFSVAGFELLLQDIEQENAAPRRLLILKYGILPHIRYAQKGELAQKLHDVLTQVATGDSDAEVSTQAMDALRRLQWGSLSQLAVARIEKARRAGDTAGAARVLEEGNEWLPWDMQVNTPGFLRTPPPVFGVVAPDRPIHVLAFGDFGTNSPAQIELASTMKRYAKQHPFDFGITLGDNFYPNGVASPDDPQWKTKWEDLYTPLGLKFYASLGNHDYMRADGPSAEVLYSQRSPSWRMPATYYTYTASPVQFFVVDTIELSDTPLPNQELAWLDTEIAKSKARWKVVYGHYQIYSATRGDEQNLIKRLLPLLRNRVDVYLCGHDHNLQGLKEEDGVHFYVSGAGGAGLYDFRQPNYSHSEFKQKTNGFTVIEADQKELKVHLISTNGEDIYTSTIRK
jgi:hypothetical protein